MTAAAIAAQLVDMRNVGTHKVLKLTIHIPEEQALAAIAAFGWPTGVDPVPIAIARLTEDGSGPSASRATRTDIAPGPDNTGGDHVTGPKAPALPRQKETAGGAKQAWRDMRLPNQAGILCNTPAFERFVRDEFPGYHDVGIDEFVRQYCDVTSRSDIRPRCPSGDKWTRLVEKYRTWMHHPAEFAS